MTDILTPGRNTWRMERADNFAVIVDAEDYFHAARDAMMRARHSIMMVGWDFDARIRFDSPDHSDDAPDHLGDFVLWLVAQSPDLHIRLLQWNSGMMKNWFRGTNAWYLARWKMHKRITARMDGVHPPAGSHHQKLLIVDDTLAFCGGIDMTVKRWDTRAHADDEPGRVSPSGRKLEPWHDCAALMDGAAAGALAELGRRRWHRATGETLEPATTPPLTWPDTVTPLVRNAQVAVCRSRPRMTDQTPVREIEALYLDLIAQAKHVIYAESQYFASRRIAAALSKRLEEADGPEVVILNPHTADGWLEPLAMDTARARLIQSLRQHDRYGRLAVYHPVTAGEKPIYVHAKLMIVDDRFLRVGSSNFNNRSMRLDSECDVALDAAQDAGGAMGRALVALRDDLLAEHLGCAPADVTATIARHGSVIAAIEGLRGAGRSLVPYEVPDLSAVEEWLADNEILDPDGPDEMFEAPGKRGLFRGRLRSPGGD